MELFYHRIKLVYCSIKLTHRSTKLFCHYIDLVYRHIELVYRSSELLYRKDCDIMQSWRYILYARQPATQNSNPKCPAPGMIQTPAAYQKYKSYKIK